MCKCWRVRRLSLASCKSFKVCYSVKKSDHTEVLEHSWRTFFQLPTITQRSSRCGWSEVEVIDNFRRWPSSDWILFYLINSSPIVLIIRPIWTFLTASFEFESFKMAKVGSLCCVSWHPCFQNQCFSSQIMQTKDIKGSLSNNYG